MAVYTQVSAEAMAVFLERYDVGTLISAKGIAEGVENSNYLIETETGRFILTLYEKRVAEADLPYFLGLTAHLSHKGLPVPAPVRDRRGEALQRLAGRPACLIEFLPGVSVAEPRPKLAAAAGCALAELHAGAADFAGTRPNALSLAGWRRLADECASHFDEIAPGLGTTVAKELDFLEANWPEDLDRATIHADLFPDNVLALGTRVTGIIDFYFACTDIRAYDLAITHAAWCFSGDGRRFDAACAEALVEGYAAGGMLSAREREALPILCRGAALRFTLTRAYDWIHTPPGALVTRKDPLAFARRLDHYRQA